jgi:hypothetical protein
LSRSRGRRIDGQGLSRTGERLVQLVVRKRRFTGFDRLSQGVRASSRVFLIRSKQAELASQRCRIRVPRIERVDAIEQIRNPDGVAALESAPGFRDPLSDHVLARRVDLGKECSRFRMRVIELQRALAGRLRQLELT